MNPPYNATKRVVTLNIQKWASKVTQDPSKGLHFVEWVARQVTGQGEDKTIKNKTAKIAVLLHASCYWQ